MKPLIRNCQLSGDSFEISEAEVKFYNERAANLGLNELPLPIYCPEERLRRRLSHRNFRHLHQRKCDATGNMLISMYGSNVKFPVYDQEYWWSDKWNPLSFGREYDFTRTFFEQYQELSSVVPRYHTMNLNSENCGYCNMTNNSKNCYLVFGCVNDLDCLYGHIVWYSESTVDTLYSYRCKWCSNSIDIVDCYDVHVSQECINCVESYFLFDCHSCTNCFGCWGLRHKQYCFLNEQLTKDEYEARLGNILPLDQQAVRNWRAEIDRLVREHHIFPNYFGFGNEDVSGNHIYESKNVLDSYDIKSGENLRYCATINRSSNAQDLSFGGTQTFCMECVTCPSTNEVLFSHLVSDSFNVIYSELCSSSNNLIGCVGLKRAENAILNISYSNDDYSRLKKKILAHLIETGELGQFFPSRLSPFAYNESIAQEYLPLHKEDVLQRGLLWAEERMPSQAEIKPSPRFFSDLSTNASKEIFTSRLSGKAFKYIPQEIDFYQRTKMPPADITFEERHLERMKARSPRKSFKRECAICSVEVTAFYDSSWAPKVACKNCYLKE